MKIMYIHIFRHNNEAHKNCDKEKFYLKQKITDLQSKLLDKSESNTPNNSIHRIITESPAPFRKAIHLDSLNDAFVGNYESPSLVSIWFDIFTD